MVDICSLPASTVVKPLPCCPETAPPPALPLWLPETEPGVLAEALPLLELAEPPLPPQAARDRVMAAAMAKARIFFMFKTPFQMLDSWSEMPDTVEIILR